MPPKPLQHSPASESGSMHSRSPSPDEPHPEMFFSFLDKESHLMLRIPSEFTDRFPGGLPHMISLVSPLRFWPGVFVAYAEEAYWFAGPPWSAFFRANAFQGNELVMFRLRDKRRAIFEAIVFDNSGCERVDFPATRIDHNPSPQYTPAGSSRAYNTAAVEDQPLRRAARRAKATNPPRSQTRRRSSREGHTVTAEEPAPFSFQLVHKTEYWRYIPAKYARATRLDALPHVHLVGENGEVWKVTLGTYDVGRVFNSGWKEFVDGNNLIPGDVVCFNYNPSERDVFCVSIQQK